MLRVLFVCPHFAPANAPDGHRVRLLLPHLDAAGIDAEVLTADPAASHFPTEEWLGESIPGSVPVHRARTRSREWSRVPGFGSLSARAMPGLRDLGDRILAEQPFDLVFFSTTQFGVHLLGPRWKRKFGVPFLMDFQDPWVNDYYREHPGQVPPGGKWKFAAADRINRWAEPRVLAHCSGITCVSPAYPASLATRYAGRPDVPEALFREALVAPFPAEQAELDRVRSGDVRQAIFDPGDGCRHWVYTGRCGPFMEKSVRAIFHAIRLSLPDHPERHETASRLRLHFVGTSYSGSASDSPVGAAAREFGLESIVEEIPGRIPLSESLRCLLDADALLVPGSDDPGYSASKIHPYLMADKPLLAVFHRESPVTKLLRDLGGGVPVPFTDSDPVEVVARQIVETAIGPGPSLVSRPLDRERFQAHTAAAQARRLGDFFRSVLHPQSNEIEDAA